jgi:hypothetical protein
MSSGHSSYLHQPPRLLEIAAPTSKKGVPP